MFNLQKAPFPYKYYWCVQAEIHQKSVQTLKLTASSSSCDQLLLSDGTQLQRKGCLIPLEICPCFLSLHMVSICLSMHSFACENWDAPQDKCCTCDISSTIWYILVGLHHAARSTRLISQCDNVHTNNTETNNVELKAM